ncbi:MAG: thioredoxin [Bacteroidales bacterium]|nr:thioredoxin [Bacteroidales bacterium]MCF8456914.1 thioredoxin [Bacteroidales bacterium]
MKNTADTPPSKNIKILNNKNFKTITRKGLVLVDFWAPWCGPCKMIAPVLNEIAENHSDQVTIAKVNVDQQQPLAQSYSIRNIPTMILFKDGKEQKRIMGFKAMKALLKEIGIG